MGIPADTSTYFSMMVSTLLLLSFLSLGRASPTSLHGLRTPQDRFGFGLMKPTSSPTSTAPWWSGLWPNNGGYFGFGIFGTTTTTTSPAATTTQCGGLFGSGMFCGEDTTPTTIP